MVKSQEEICSLQGPQCIHDRLTVWTGGLEVRADLLPHTAATFDSFNKDTTVTVQHNFRVRANLGIFQTCKLCKLTTPDLISDYCKNDAHERNSSRSSSSHCHPEQDVIINIGPVIAILKLALAHV